MHNPFIINPIAVDADCLPKKSALNQHRLERIAGLLHPMKHWHSFPKPDGAKNVVNVDFRKVN